MKNSTKSRIIIAIWLFIAVSEVISHFDRRAFLLLASVGVLIMAEVQLILLVGEEEF